MNTCDMRLDELMCRCGGRPIGSLTADFTKRDLDGLIERIASTTLIGDGLEKLDGTQRLILKCLGVIENFSDTIDALETALDNQTTLNENLLHIIGNADVPDGVSYEDFCAVVDSIYKAIQLAKEGWETYEEGVPKDDD